MHTIALFGGTFDPVHNGHLLTSLAIQDYFHFQTYYFLPCKIPLLKNPAYANKEQRIAMLQLIIKEYQNSNFKLDLREINRDSPSYMVDTLLSFRKEYKHSALTLILGYDTFLSLPLWHQWEKIINLANIVIINRNYYANNPIPAALVQLLNKTVTTDKKTILTKTAGYIYLFDAGNYTISSTQIRQGLKENDPRLPQQIYKYIKSQALYQ